MLAQNLVTWFSQLPDALSTVLIAMLPIGELRLSIPIALGAYDMSVAASYVWSVIGNLIPVIFLLLFLEPASAWLTKKSVIAKKFFDWLFERTRKRFYKKHARYGDVALIILVAIPLPVTGAWTGSVAAFLFDIPKRRAFGLIAAGVLIAGVIVTLISKGTFTII